MILRFFEVPMLWSRHLALLLAFGAFVALTGCASTSDEVPETAAEQAEVAATNDPKIVHMPRTVAPRTSRS